MQTKPEIIRYSLVFILLLLAGCSYIPSLPSMPWSTTQSRPDPTAEALFEEGMAHFNNKRYVRAIDVFQKIKSEHPFSPQLISAELKVAEAYYLNKQYPDAAAAFKEFQSLHPTNENIPMVVYHLGLAHFDQFTSSDRYQKTTEIARDYFETVVKSYPNSPYARPAREKLAQCLQYLAEHEFNIASFYLREKKYPAAIDRLEGIVTRYPDTAVAPKALYYLGESYRSEKNPLKAALAYEAFIQRYPGDPLAKTAQAQLSELSKERVDPLAMLLKRDGRPTIAVAQAPGSAEIQNPKSEIQNRQELNLVAKKEVVHEEPGDEKGFFRRVADKINPFASSDSDKKDGGNKNVELAKKEESPSRPSSFWSSLNPFSKGEKPKVEAGRDPGLVARVDESLKQKGISASESPEDGIQNPQSKIQNLGIEPPAVDLPQVSEQSPPPTDTAELLGRIDANLKRGGTNVANLPPAPDIHPYFLKPAPEAKTTAPAKPEPSPAATAGLIATIDQGLRRQGMDPAKIETGTKTEDRRPTAVQSSAPQSQPKADQPRAEAVSRQEKVELAPRLPAERSPFAVGPGEYRGQEVEKVSEPTEKVETEKPAEPARGIPQAIVKGPPQPQRQSPTEIKPADKKKSNEEDEEGRGMFDQLKEDMDRVRKLLNPFNWW